MTVSELIDRLQLHQNAISNYPIKSFHDGYVYGCKCLFEVKDIKINKDKQEIILDARE